MKYDVIVVGSGPGGYVAAIRAAQLGFKVACIEKEPTLGGTCLNVGCIPSKALLSSSWHYQFLLSQAKEHGIEIEKMTFHFNKMMERKQAVVKGLVEGIGVLFKKHHIDWIQGKATFKTPHLLSVEGKSIEGDSIILAVGSKPISLPLLPFDEQRILSSTGALSLSAVPKTLAVIGAGVIGVELASVYSRLGCRVTVIEMLDQICLGLDKSVSFHLLAALKKQGIEFLLSSQLTQATLGKSALQLSCLCAGVEKTIDADAVLVAVGRRPNTEGLGLEDIGIKLDKKGFVEVDGAFRTNFPHIFAIGDLIQGPMLAHRASDEGMAVSEAIFGLKPQINEMAIASVVYTDPEAAACGLTEQEAKLAGLSLLIGTSFFKGNPRARCANEQEGFVKVIGEKKTGKLVGMHILGAHASELIQEGVLAIQKNVTLEELAKLSCAHPTLSEAIKEAAQQALGFAIHAH